MLFPDNVYCGDMIEILKSLDARTVDLIITSPPYNLQNSTGDGLRDRRGSKWQAAPHKEIELVSVMPHKRYVQWQRRCMAAMFRVLKEDGAIFYIHKERVQDGLLQDRSDILDGFPLRQKIIWERAGGINFNAGYFLPTYEIIYMIAKHGFRLRNDALARGDVWRIPQERVEEHLSFPIEIPLRIISSTDARLVLDPFCGSGTVCVAAAREGRQYIGIDKSIWACERSRERLQGVRATKGIDTY